MEAEDTITIVSANEWTKENDTKGQFKNKNFPDILNDCVLLMKNLKHHFHRTDRLRRTAKWSGTTRSAPRILFWCFARSFFSTNASFYRKWVFALFFYLFLFRENTKIHEIFHFPHAAIAINRHSTHHRRQLTKIEPRKGEVSSRSKIQPSILTPMAEQMEKLQLTQTVSPLSECSERDFRERNA